MAHICHKSHELGRGTSSLLSVLAFSIALKCGSVLRAAVLLSSWGRNDNDPSLLLTHEAVFPTLFPSAF